jgi:hypothetical protein
MMRVARRVVLVLLVAGLWSGAGSALLTPPAAAGGVNPVGGDISTWNFTAAIYNATPFRWTLVKARSPRPCDGETCWRVQPPQTIAPGGSGGYALRPWVHDEPGLVSWGWRLNYDGWFTYRVDQPGVPSFYVTLSITQCYCRGIYGPDNPNPFPWLQITTQPPPDDWDPASASPPPPPPVPTLPPPGNGGLTWQLGVPYPFDLTFAPIGDFTIDASTDQGQPFVDLLNALCSGQTGTSCSFTQQTPITYGPGALGGKQTANNCDLSSAAGGNEPSTRTGAPPDNDPNYYLLEYEAAQSASLSVGGGITVGTEFELFQTIASEASVSVEAEHEWEEVKTFTRETRVYIPSNSWGFVWVAPTVGRVTGTIVATIGSATFTAKNFTEVRSGVTGATDPLKQPIPAFNVVTKTRPMTAAEKARFCGASSSSRLKAAARLRSRRAAPPARLVPHRSVARVKLGETQEAVVARLGWPAEKRFALNPCKGLPGCTAIRGLGGTWNYRKRKLSVVFGPDRRVAALVHGGSQRTVDGVGKHSTPAAVRGKFPGVSCARFAKKVDCTVKRVSGQRTVRTVFRLTERGGRWKTTKVLIYLDGGEQVGS